MAQNNIKEFGEQIRDTRKAQGLTQDQLAELCGKEQSYISSAENGTINISLDVFMDIMAHMQVRVAVTVEGVEIKSNYYIN